MLDLRDERARSAWLLEKLREMNHLHGITRRELSQSCGTADPVEAARRFRYLIGHARSLYGTVKKHEKYSQLITGKPTMLNVLIRYIRRDRIWRSQLRLAVKLLEGRGEEPYLNALHAAFRRAYNRSISVVEWDDFLRSSGVELDGDRL